MEGSWAGFIQEGSSVHDTNGVYVGLLLDEGRIALDPTNAKPRSVAPPPPQIASHLPYTVPRRPKLPPLPKPYREAVLITADSTRRSTTFVLAPIVFFTGIGVSLGAYLYGRNQSTLPEAGSFWSSDNTNILAATISIALLVAMLWFAASNVRGRQTCLFLVGAAKSRAAIKDVLTPLVGQSIRYIEIEATVDSVDATDPQVRSLYSRAGRDLILFTDHLDPIKGEFMVEPNLHLNDRTAFERIVDVPRFAEADLGFLLPDAESTRAYFTSDSHSARTIFYRVVTRWFDILLATSLLVFSAPIMLISALAIRLDSPGPIFISQDRVGIGEKVFSLLRFRTMRVDAEEVGRPIWAIARDSRITAIGRVLRKLRIDELPQLFCVLRGDMSMVGPRPERPYFVEQLTNELPAYRWRARVKPGVTGWAQVRYLYGYTMEDGAKKLAYDLYYVKNRSVFLDLRIILETIGVVLTGKAS